MSFLFALVEACKTARDCPKTSFRLHLRDYSQVLLIGVFTLVFWCLPFFAPTFPPHRRARGFLLVSTFAHRRLMLDGLCCPGDAVNTDSRRVFGTATRLPVALHSRLSRLAPCVRPRVLPPLVILVIVRLGNASPQQCPYEGPGRQCARRSTRAVPGPATIFDDMSECRPPPSRQPLRVSRTASLHMSTARAIPEKQRNTARSLNERCTGIGRLPPPSQPPGF